MRNALLFFLLVLWMPSLWATSLLVGWSADSHDVSIATLNILEPQEQPPQREVLFTTSDSRVVRYTGLSQENRLILLRYLRQHPDVVYAEVDGQLHQQSLPYTPLLPNDWQVNQPRFACQHYPIAIIDSLVDIHHEALDSPRVRFSEVREFRTSFSEEDSKAHATHLAGIIAARPDQERNIGGVCDLATLISYGFMDDRRAGSISEAARAITRAVDQGAAIINASWGAFQYNQTLETAIQYANDQGVLLVASAGNNGRSIDARLYYPAAFSQTMDLVVAVAALDQQQNQRHTTATGGSNWGYAHVSLAAPGFLIPGLYPDNRYAQRTGTSMATAFVSGALAGIAQTYPHESPRAHIAALLNSARPLPSLQAQTRHASTLDTQRFIALPRHQLFQPIWFRHQWLADQQSFTLYGHDLDQVTDVRWIDHQHPNPAHHAIPLAQQSQEQLSLILPSGLQGELRLYTPLGALPSVHLDWLASTELPLITDDPETQRILWQGHLVEVQRLAGISDTPWTIEVVHHGSEEQLRLSGSNLSGDWQWRFVNEQPWYGLQVRREGRSALTLAQAEGYESISNSSGRWVINRPAEWLANTQANYILLKPLASAPSKGNEDTRCYIATSVYGDAHAPEVQALRAFRDQHLLPHASGRLLVNQYYRHSPAIARLAEQQPWLKSASRQVLDTLVEHLIEE